MTQSGADVLEALEAVLAQRRDADPERSYVAGLHAAGLDRILEKLGEEAVETILAAKNAERDGNETVVHETADLWFHSLVMLSELDVPASAVLDELARRFGVSGHAEKAARGG